MPAATYNFEVEQGTTLVKPLVYKDSLGAPVNLTGYSAKMQIRPSISSEEVLLELSTVNGKIVIVPLLGKLTLTMSPADTSALTSRRARYDLEITAGDGSVTRLIEGEITVSREVTR
jgi:hypothetical protein